MAINEIAANVVLEKDFATEHPLCPRTDCNRCGTGI